MKLKGTQISSLQTALLSAFDYEQLRQMLYTQLDQQLEEIAPVAHASLTEIVYAVIRWYAAQEGGVHKLVKAARAANPGHAELARVADSLLAHDFDPLPKDGPAAPALDLRLVAAAVVVFVLIAAGVYIAMNGPKPMPELGYNLAVAAFDTPEANGDAGAAEVARAIGDWFFSAVEKDVAHRPENLQYNLRGPQEIGVVAGATAAERAAAARKKAQELKAAVLIYGTVFAQDGQYYVQPEFYVNDQDTFFYASSLVGPNQLGAPITVTLPLNPGGQFQITEALDARRQVLEHTILGLGQFFIDEYEQAKGEFRSAANTPNWSDAEGKEISYLLIAAAALRQYDMMAAPASLDDAERALRKAHAINEQFARAQLGLGTILVERAGLIDPHATTAGPGQVALLKEAATWFEGARTARDQGPMDFIGIKADYGLGRVHLLGAQLHAEGYTFEKAEKYFHAVISAVDQADFAYLQRFSAQAHAGLGWAAGLQQDHEAMAKEYRTANEIWSTLPAGKDDLTIARNWAKIGWAEGELHHYCDARDAYGQAVGVGARAPTGRDEVDKWRKFIEDIDAQKLCKLEA
jgi:hypothetical protein